MNFSDGFETSKPPIAFSFFIFYRSYCTFVGPSHKYLQLVFFHIYFVYYFLGFESFGQHFFRNIWNSQGGKEFVSRV